MMKECCGSEKIETESNKSEEEEEEEEVMEKEPQARLQHHCHVTIQQQLDGDLDKKRLENFTSALPKILVEDLAPFLKGRTTCIRINELPSRFIIGISKSQSEIEESDIQNGIAVINSSEDEEIILDPEPETQDPVELSPMEPDQRSLDPFDVQPEEVIEVDQRSLELEDRFAVEPEEVITLEELLAGEIKTTDTNIPELLPVTSTAAAMTSTSRSQLQLKAARQTLAQARIGKSRKMKRRLYYTDARYRKSKKLLQTSRSLTEQPYQGQDEGQIDQGQGGSDQIGPAGQEEVVDLTCDDDLEPLKELSGGSRTESSPTKSEASLPDCNQNSILLSIEETKEAKGVENSQENSNKVTKATEVADPKKNKSATSTTTTRLEELAAASSCSRPKRQIQRPRRLLEAFVTPTIRATKVVKKPLIFTPLTLKKEEENLTPEAKEEEEEEAVEKVNSTQSRSPSASPARPEFSPIKTPVKSPPPTETPKDLLPNSESASRALCSLDQVPKKRKRRQPVMASRSRSSPVLCVHENLEIGMFYLIAQEGNRMQVMRFNGTTMEPLDLGWVDTIRASAADASATKESNCIDDEPKEDMKGDEGGEEEAILNADSNLLAAA